jgi:hypothetical protein
MTPRVAYKKVMELEFLEGQGTDLVEQSLLFADVEQVRPVPEAGRPRRITSKKLRVFLVPCHSISTCG